MLKNAALDAKIGVDTAENEPQKGSEKWVRRRAERRQQARGHAHGLLEVPRVLKCDKSGGFLLTFDDICFAVFLQGEDKHSHQNRKTWRNYKQENFLSYYDDEKSGKESSASCEFAGSEHQLCVCIGS